MIKMDMILIPADDATRGALTDPPGQFRIGKRSLLVEVGKRHSYKERGYETGIYTGRLCCAGMRLDLANINV